jgi:hypothetical protein
MDIVLPYSLERAGMLASEASRRDNQDGGEDQEIWVEKEHLPPLLAPLSLICRITEAALMISKVLSVVGRKTSRKFNLHGHLLL